MKQKPRLLWSELTGRVYIVTKYREHGGRLIEASEKFDVTDEFNALSHRAPDVSDIEDGSEFDGPVVIR